MFANHAAVVVGIVCIVFILERLLTKKFNPEAEPRGVLRIAFDTAIVYGLAILAQGTMGDATASAPSISVFTDAPPF